MQASTVADLDAVSEREVRRARNLRRVAIAALATFIVLGATGVFGVRTGSVSATGGGYDLTVRYAQVSRGGLDTPWSVVVHRDGGFDGPVTVATTQTYLDAFDENGLNPDPATTFTDGDLLVWEFDPPVGDTLTVIFDARAGPSLQAVPKHARTAVLVDGLPVVEVSYRTWIMP